MLDFGQSLTLGLCDTTGRAIPDHVAGVCQGSIERFDRDHIDWVFHGHDTFGLGVANALYAYDAGVRGFDASVAGLGGCPFAPGATGNTATEDLVFTFTNMGIDTGIDSRAYLMLQTLLGLCRTRIRADTFVSYLGRAHWQQLNRQMKDM